MSPDKRGRGSGAQCEALGAAAAAVLTQCEALVRQLSAQTYTAESATMKGGTVGKHLRHTLDHFAAVMVPLGRPMIDGAEPIDYDHRERNVPMETDRSAALDAISSLRVRLSMLSPDALEASVYVRVMVSGDGSEAQLRTSIGRELAFATHHAVHHQAMMRAIAQEFGVQVDAEFGKAPSTVNYEAARRPGS